MSTATEVKGKFKLVYELRKITLMLISRKDYMRSSVFMWLWRGCANYFPLELVKTAELPPTTNYVFGFFPHAYAWSFGSYGHFVAQATNFRQLFPGVRSKSALAPFNFFIPFLRDTLLAGGAMSNSAESVKFALMRSNDPKEIYNRDGFTSNAVSITNFLGYSVTELSFSQVVLTVGGMREAFFAQPGVNRVNLRNRKGFIKIAIRAGVPVVPIYSFNEIEVYNFIRLDHSSKLYQFIQNLLGFVPPLGLNGRGFFQYTFGTIPRRHRIVTVIGASIQTVKNDSPSIEEINEVHQKFMDAMYQLFEAHKHKYLENPDQAVLIME